jgi:uncharacterized protein with GYD domain
MALTLVLGKLTPEAMRGLMKEGLAARERYFRELAESVGMTVHGYYFAEGGEWDVVVLAEAPDAPGAEGVANVFQTQSTGMYASIRALRLYAPADVDAGLAKAAQLRAPGS